MLLIVVTPFLLISCVLAKNGCLRNECFIRRRDYALWQGTSPNTDTANIYYDVAPPFGRGNTGQKITTDNLFLCPTINGVDGVSVCQNPNGSEPVSNSLVQAIAKCPVISPPTEYIVNPSILCAGYSIPPLGPTPKDTKQSLDFVCNAMCRYENLPDIGNDFYLGQYGIPVNINNIPDGRKKYKNTANGKTVVVKGKRGKPVTKQILPQNFVEFQDFVEPTSEPSCGQLYTAHDAQGNPVYIPFTRAICLEQFLSIDQSDIGQVLGYLGTFYQNVTDTMGFGLNPLFVDGRFGMWGVVSEISPNSNLGIENEHQQQRWCPSNFIETCLYLAPLATWEQIMASVVN